MYLHTRYSASAYEEIVYELLGTKQFKGYIHFSESDMGIILIFWAAAGTCWLFYCHGSVLHFFSRLYKDEKYRVSKSIKM